MTDRIEEMIKIAGVNFTTVCRELKKQGFPHCGRCPVIHSISCDRIATPDFTPEKQLEIIKLIGQRQEVLYTFDFEGDCVFQVENTVIHNEDFVQALAQLTTELMKAGELEKEKVKGILEG